MAIKRRWFRPIMVSVSVFIYSMFISFGMSLFNNGFTLDFIMNWPKNWLVAFCVAFPTIWFLQPLIAKWVHNIKFTD
ncbi:MULTISPECIES: DUF2798 domain-containing protein [unclassified Lonepinella]|uniref:DUF2798 domain-containing protein n=1 Tax=unclassified Lonepinella TaxID=2642006 RepID=UPI003F6E3EB6